MYTERQYKKHDETGLSSNGRKPLNSLAPTNPLQVLFNEYRCFLLPPSMPSMMQSIAGRGFLTRYLMHNFPVTAKNSTLRIVLNCDHSTHKHYIHTKLRESVHEKKYTRWTLYNQLWQANETFIIFSKLSFLF